MYIFEFLKPAFAILKTSKFLPWAYNVIVTFLLLS